MTMSGYERENKYFPSQRAISATV